MKTPNKKIDQWILDNTNKHLCSCGCQQFIKLKRRYYNSGIPKYIHGHNSKGINHPSYGKHPTEETKLKLSDSHKGQISGFKGKSHTEESNEKNRLAHIGLNSGIEHWNWQGGITEINHAIKISNQYYEWRLMILGRDSYTCQECGKRGEYLEVHHIKAFSMIMNENNIKTLDDAINCTELWDLNNGITLCKSCHSKTSNYNGRALRNNNEVI